MSNYKYEIYTNGYSNELVIGTLTKEDFQKIENILEENDLSTTELYQDWDILEENDLVEWHENDNKEHVYGPSLSESSINIIDKNTNVEILKKDFKDFNEKQSKHNSKIFEFEDEPLFYAYTTEKGVAMDATLELNEPFQEEKFNFEYKSIIIDDYEHKIITKLYYDGEEIITDFNSSSGKDFSADIIIG